MRHDVGYGKPLLHSHDRSRSQSRSHTRKHGTHASSTVTANHHHPAHETHTSNSSLSIAAKAQSQAQTLLPDHPKCASSLCAPDHPNPSSRSRSHSVSSRSRATIDPANRYADCTGHGNPWIHTSSTHDSGPQRTRSMSPDRAAHNALKAHNARWRARDGERPRWPLRWPSMSTGGSEMDN